MKLNAPAALRNREPILERLRHVLPPSGLVLEIASGTGQHVVHFAAALPHLTFQPTDLDAPALASIRAWTAELELTNVRDPLRLDASAPEWPIPQADALYSANMIHIAPWSAALGLFAGAARVLPPGAPFILYGPFAFSGRFTAPSNAEFDASLRHRDPAWGIRDLDDLTAVAQAEGLTLTETHALPANNHLLVFRRDLPAPKPS